MGIRRFAKFSRNARTLACVDNRLSSPKVRHCPRSGMSPPRADDPDRRRLLHDDLSALSISSPHPVAARLVVGPDDVRMSSWVTSDTTRWRRAVTGSVRKSMVVTPNAPRAPSGAPMLRIRRQPLTPRFVVEAANFKNRGHYESL